MGCGKSSVGRRLSELLCCPCMDLDEMIEAKAGRTIPEIFATDGEAAFRTMERKMLENLLMPLPYSRHTAEDLQNPSKTAEGSDCMILSLGGGTVMTAGCAEMVHEHTTCIYLRASIDTLVMHLEGETANRPMLSNNPDESSIRERIAELMALRSATYEHTAHIIIDIDGKSIDEIADTILSRIQSA